jgi:hypothetical protein
MHNSFTPPVKIFILLIFSIFLWFIGRGKNHSQSAKIQAWV